MTSLTELTQPELDVMLLLAQSRTTNVVILAADLWRTTPDWLATDPYPLLTFTLEALSERGLCTFRIKPGVSLQGRKKRTPDLPMDIRLTPKGWGLMGYPNKTVEVGSSGRHERESNHPGDMTDYVNLAGITFGGPIEKDTFAEHRRNYHDHNHMYGVPIPMANQSTGPRPYTRVTAEIQASILHARETLGPVGYADIAEYTGHSASTVKYVLTELPRLRRTHAGEAKTQGSLKERVMTAVKTIGPIKDVAELRRIVGMADSDHDVMHVLHSLHTQGRVDFTERGNGMGTATAVDIHVPKKGSRRVDRETYEALPEIVKDRLPEQLVEAAESEATTEEPQVLPPSAPGPESAGYPLLDALLDRERKRLDGDTKGMAFVVAAEAIQDIDPDTARELMAKAKQYDVPFPTPVEQEYIRYVAAHTKATDANER